MTISKEELEKFKKIIKKDYGIELDDKEALTMANDFLISLDAVLKPGKNKV